MNAGEVLSRSRPCQGCGRMILAGTPLSELRWDPINREWSHLRLACPEAGARTEHSDTAGTGLTGVGSTEEAPASANPRAAMGEPVARELARGPWSVTVEVHTGPSPEHSRRVVRIARLHLATYEEASSVADSLRKFDH